MRIALYTSWKIDCDENHIYYFPFTHYVYTKFASENFEEVYVVASTRTIHSKSAEYKSLDLSNVHVISVPNFSSFLSAQILFFHYLKAINKIRKKVDIIYVRAHAPYSWLPSFIFNKKIIMHFVGDAIGATLKNEKWSKLKKIVMIIGYYPDYLLTLFAARISTAYANGDLLASKISKFGVRIKPVVSSTVSKFEMNDKLPELPKQILTLIYVGYLRNAKGINTIMSLIELLNNSKVNFLFHIVGDGEMFNELNSFINRLGLSNNVILHGHIDERTLINSLYLSSDLFIFPSLSEGSPRVVIEAMSQGIPVLSTPVGSLPSSFNDHEDIHFFDYSDINSLRSLIDSYIINSAPFIIARNNAYEKVKKFYTLEQFLKIVFEL